MVRTGMDRYSDSGKALGLGFPVLVDGLDYGLDSGVVLLGWVVLRLWETGCLLTCWLL